MGRYRLSAEIEFDAISAQDALTRLASLFSIRSATALAWNHDTEITGQFGFEPLWSVKGRMEFGQVGSEVFDSPWKAG